MKPFLSLFLSGSLVAVTAAAALAGQGDGGAAIVDHRTHMRPADAGEQSHGFRDHRDDGDDARPQRKAPVRFRAWRDLASSPVVRRQTVLDLDAQSRGLDELRLEVRRGTVTVREVIVTFADGTTYSAKVGQRLADGTSTVIDLPGRSRRVTRVELRHGRGPLLRNRALIAIAGR